MKKIFTKAITVLGSAALLGSTVGVAAAAAYPAPFTSNSAIVVGAGAAATDFTAATNIASALDSVTAGSVGTTLTGGESITEDEVTLGGFITTTSDIDNSTVYGTGKSKLSNLKKEKLKWNDGTGSADYDIYEEITIGDMKVITSLEDEDLEGVALTNKMGLTYKLVFEDALPVAHVGMDNATGDADTLYLEILGEEYEITSMTNDSVTVVTSEEVSLSIGESVTIDGVSITVYDVFDGKAQVNGEIIASGSSKKISGLRVEVDTVGYHSNAPELSKVILRVGEDISKTFTDGDEYIGQDEDDPLWIWDISGLENDGGYIGVKYNANIDDADDEEAGDSIKYVGDAYVFPNNFGQVSLDSITDVDYEDIKVEFTEQDLYDSTDAGIAIEDKEVIVISAEDTDTITVGTEETDKIYIYYANNVSGTELNATNGAIEVFYRDHEGDNTPTNKARFETQFNLTAEGVLASTEIATIEIGDTNIGINIAIAAGVPTLTFVADEEDIALAIGGTALADDAGAMTQFGANADDADAEDVMVGTTDVSTKDNPIMTNYGIVLSEGSDVESQMDKDELTLSVPEDQVYAIVSLTVGGEADDDGEAGIMTYKDTETSSFAGKNLIVVGGSAINSVAAELLDGDFREAAFTEETGVAAGQFMIESFDRSGRTALLVAGYNAEDTTKAANALINSDVDTTVGTKYVSSSTTVSDTDLVTA